LPETKLAAVATAGDYEIGSNKRNGLLTLHLK
jgi:hypothetical protein